MIVTMYFVDDEEFTNYAEAVDYVNEICGDLARAGWSIEHGWASTDNLTAAKATGPQGQVRYVAVEIDHSND